MVQKFCPSCGKKTNDLVKGLCIDCFRKKRKLVEVPERLDIEYCKKCGKVFLHGRWHNQDQELLSGFVKSKIKEKELGNLKVEVALFPEGKDSVAELHISGTVEGVPAHLQKTVFLKGKSSLCDSCMKLSSDYFEATLQIRFSEKHSVEQAEKIALEAEHMLLHLQDVEPLAVIVKKKETRNGMDLLIGSKRAAKLVAEQLEKKARESMKVSFEIAGFDRDKGKEKKRFTYCLRF